MTKGIIDMTEPDRNYSSFENKNINEGTYVEKRNDDNSKRNLIIKGRKIIL